jgi:hypothetical protein
MPGVLRHDLVVLGRQRPYRLGLVVDHRRGRFIARVGDGWCDYGLQDVACNLTTLREAQRLARRLRRVAARWRARFARRWRAARTIQLAWLRRAWRPGGCMHRRLATRRARA